MLKKRSCISVLLACIAVQSLGARNIFVTSSELATPNVTVFTSDPLSFAGTLTGFGAGTRVLAGPGGKFYLVGRTPSEGIIVLEGAFPSLQVTRRIPFASMPTAVAITPNANRLVVAHSGGVQVINTATDAVVGTGITAGANSPSVAVSTDSTRAFVAVPDQQRVIVVNTENGAVISEMTIVGRPTAVSVGPNSLLYVSVQNAVYEYNPQTLELRGTFSMNGFPGAISFSPDGRTGIATSTSLVSGRAAYQLDLVRRLVTDVPSNGVLLDKILVADNATAYAYSSQTGRIYTLNLLVPAAPALYNVSGVTLDLVRDITISNESPRARFLFVLTTTGLFRVDLINGTAVGPISSPIGTLSYAGPAATGVPTTLLQINNSQTVAPGAASLPLIVRATTSEGTPLAGVQVTFATESGVTLSNVSTTTNQQGYAQATVNVPTTLTSGLVTVTATAGGQIATFNLTVSSTAPGPVDPGAPPPGGLTIESGQGQVVSERLTTNQPLTVLVRNASGAPLPNVPLTWTISEGTGSLGEVSEFTDENGRGRASYSNFLVPLGVPFTQATVSASTGTETVNFIVTTVPRLPNGGSAEAVYTLRQPTDRAIVARSGETITNAIQVVIGSLIGNAIPNVGLRIVAEDPNGVSATCRGGVPLSDLNGVVSCDLIAGPRVGSGLIRVIVGESAVYTMNLTVSAGAPSVVRILGGNNQTVATGQQLPVTLTVEVTDAGGNLLPGQTVTWEAVTAGTATFTPATSTTDDRGRASTRVTLGQTPGLVQIRARSGTGVVTFSATAASTATGLSLGGGNQTAAQGQAFANPITATLTGANGPVQGATVQFSVVSGSATLSAPSAVTNASGIASVNVTAGQQPGPVQIQATSGSLTQTVTLTVQAPGPVFTAASFLNAGNYQPGISPGGIAVINATGIATGVRGSVTPGNLFGPLPTSLSGVEVLFNGVPAPIYSVNNVDGRESVIVQVPFETIPGNNVSVTIRTANAGSTTVTGVQVLPVRPGLFDFQDVSGRRYAVALRPDGSYVSSANPARRGETVRIFVTGLGQTSPATGTNRAGGRDQMVAASVIAGINDAGVRLISAKLVEGSIGLYVVEMEIPADTRTGVSQNIATGVVAPDGSLVLAGAQIPIQ